ncbi:hypothetical protein PUN28_015506 [Cardiocondyla obscurior]|uniref:Uncharacterized protein n=1 Tax=Cardiocondyla obscurior TaxID=286306 RepID=A0AAW2ETC4_9HYME
MYIRKVGLVSREILEKSKVARLGRPPDAGLVGERPVLRLPVGKQLSAISVQRVYTADPLAVSATFLLAPYMSGIKFAVGLAAESISPGFSRAGYRSYLYGNRQPRAPRFLSPGSRERSDRRGPASPFYLEQRSLLFPDCITRRWSTRDSRPPRKCLSKSAVLCAREPRSSVLSVVSSTILLHAYA